jgi:hypothetical protein
VNARRIRRLDSDPGVLGRSPHFYMRVGRSSPWIVTPSERAHFCAHHVLDHKRIFIHPEVPETPACGEFSSSDFRKGSTVSQASGAGERPVLRRADLLHCLSALGLAESVSAQNTCRLSLSFTPWSRRVTPNADHTLCKNVPIVQSCERHARTPLRTISSSPAETNTGRGAYQSHRLQGGERYE